ncbi:MAG: TonB-dependent receptor plug domain-containing protein [Bacteroidales bacterium]|nr:TonB-dependent receptor plug domain-containing protein [Bacteroidales bacterium]
MLTHFLLPLLVATSLQAGDRLPMVMGSIRNLENQPVKAKVSLAQGGQQTHTDKNGLFFFKDVAPGDTLFIQYNKVRTAVPVAGRNTIHMKLADNLADLIRPKDKPAEKKARKQQETGGGNIFFAQDLQNTGGKNLAEAIAALGTVTVTPEGQVIMRGFNSFNADPYALILLDGTEVLSLIDVELADVSKVEILKDGEMYGVKGANGVVLITTKVSE